MSIVRLFTAPLPAVGDQPYRPGFHLAVPASQICSVEEDSVNRAWANVITGPNLNGTYNKIIVAMNFDQVVRAWELALKPMYVLDNRPPDPVYLPTPQNPYTDPNWGVGVGVQQDRLRFVSPGLPPSEGDQGPERG